MTRTWLSNAESVHRILSPLPPGATEQAQEAHAIWVLFGWVGLSVAVFVGSLIFFCLFRYRKRREDDESYPKQFRRNGKLEVIYTILPLILVATLFAYTYAAERRIEMINAHPNVVLNVAGFRWSWQFTYPQYGVSFTGTPEAPPHFELPLGWTTRVHLVSLDVDHSFWIPAFLFKRDAIPGLRNVFDLTPTQLGEFRGECGEFCGLYHARMLFVADVVTPQVFIRWIKQQQRAAQSSLQQGVVR